MTRLATGWFFLLIAGVGLVTAFFRLGTKGLWGDEVWQALWSQQQPLPQTFQRFRAPPDLPLHFLLTQISTVFGQSPFWVRLPSALLAVLTVVVVFLLGRRAFGNAVATAGALLLALAPFHVWYAQEARPYAALACYSLLTLYFFYRLLQRPRADDGTCDGRAGEGEEEPPPGAATSEGSGRRGTDCGEGKVGWPPLGAATTGARWDLGGTPSWFAAIGFTIATILNLYNHLFGLFPLLVEAIAVVVWAAAIIVRSRDVNGGKRSVLLSLGAVIGGIIVSVLAAEPLWIGIANYLAHGGPGEVQAPPFQVTPGFLGTLFSLFGAGPDLMLWLMLGLVVVGVGVGLWRGRWFVLLAFAWLGLPILLLWFTQPRHIFIPRYFLFMQPVYLLLVAYGAWELAQAVSWLSDRALAVRQRWLHPAVYSVLVVLLGTVTFTPTWRGYWVEKVNDWSAICSYLQHRAKPGDVVSGNQYAPAIMTWCFHPSDPIAVASNGAYSPQALTSGGRNVWYILIGSDTPSPDDAYVRHSYRPLPLSAWSPGGMQLDLKQEVPLYPIAEHLAALYYHPTRFVPNRLTFHDVRLSEINSALPDYAPVVPGGDLAVRLSARSARAQLLHVLWYERAGSGLRLLANGVEVGVLSPSSVLPQWTATNVTLPPGMGQVLLVEMRNPGKVAVPVAEVDVR